MGKPVRTLVTFASTAFNTNEMKEAFINVNCYVDDFSTWFIRELRRRGLQPGESPARHHAGWSFTFTVGEDTHDFIIGYRPARGRREGIWVGWLERRRGLIGSALLSSNWGVRQTAADAVHDIFSGTTRISQIRWHHREEFDAGLEELWAAVPVAA